MRRKIKRKSGTHRRLYIDTSRDGKRQKNNKTDRFNAWVVCVQGVCGERKGVVVWWCGAVSGVLL